MAKVYYYSKRYSQQGSAISPVSYNDLLLISRAVPITPTEKLGYRTYATNIDTLKNYTINALKRNGTTFRFNNGLLGTGTALDPIRVDKDWVNQTYINSSNWPFSQVGDPTETTLPISGSYFSVTYPYINDTSSPVTPYVEGNGDMRIIRTVTNGEDIAPVYSVWKNYKNTSINTMVHTDIVYKPPGLAADEFIYHVYTASDTAMLIEIWSKTSGFREYGFVVLNGTLTAASHRIIRLGNKPVTVLAGVSNQATINSLITYFRTTNLCAAIVKGRMYIGTILPYGALEGTTANGDQSIVRLAFAEVTEAGSVTLINNWTATNSEGSVTTNAKMAILNSALSTADDSNKDAVFLNQMPSKVVFGFGYNATNRTCWGGVNSNGRLTMVNYHYFTVGTSGYETDAKPTYYYEIDFDNHTVSPPTGATGRRWAYVATATNGVLRTAYSKTYLEGHYYADGRMVGLLNNGDRFCQHMPANSGIYQYFSVMRGDVTSTDTATNDNNFINDNLNSTRWMGVPPPTPLISGGKATILYDKLRVVNQGGENAASDWVGGSLSLISGSATGKTYKLIDPANVAVPTTWYGYPLNNNRIAQKTPKKSGMIAFRKNGVMYYHNACWTSYDSVSTVYNWTFDSSDTPYYNMKISQLVIDKMKAFLTAIPIDSGYTQVSDTYWSIVPFYPGLGEDYALVRFLYSFKAPDSSAPDGWARSYTRQIFAMAPITFIVDSLNVATVSDINLTNVPTTAPNFSGINVYYASDWHAYGSVAIDISSTSYRVIHRGGPMGSLYASSTSEGMWPQAHEFDRSLNHINQYFNCGGVGYGPYPTIHPTYGIGFIDVVGLGAFYAFRPYMFNGNRIGNNTESYIVGSARPAAGFNLTINAPFNVYVEGCNYTIPVQVMDLTTITPYYSNAYFYCYVVVRNGVAKFVVSKTVLNDHLHCIYVGYIRTSDTEIVEINCTPITRWEVARTSIYPNGNSIPVSTGLANEKNVKVWENATTIAGTAAEYMWGGDDIVDSDIDYLITDVYWAYDQAGNSPIQPNPLYSSAYYSDVVYLIVKTIGISDSVDLTFDRSGIEQVDMAVGTISGTIKVPITYNSSTGVGIGFYKLQTMEMDDMAFNNATWLDVTNNRALGVDYTNTLNYAIMVNVSLNISDVSTYAVSTMMVDGVVVGNGRLDISDGGGRYSCTFSAIVPAGSVYRVTAGSGATYLQWAELGRR